MIGDFLSMLFALIGTVCVILLTYYVSRWYAKRLGPIAGGRHIKVVDRLAVSKTGSVLIIEIEGKQFLLGVSDQNIRILLELEEAVSFIESGSGEEGLKSLFSKNSYKSLLDAAKKRRGVD